MKINGNVLLTWIGIVFLCLFYSSCSEDDFSEEDLLNMQIDLISKNDSTQRANAIAALDSAGAFFDFSVIVNNNDQLVAGASVSLLGQQGGTISKTTDSNGSVNFEGVKGGGNVMFISASGFAGATLNVDFPELKEGVNYEITSDGTYVPLKASTSVIVPIFAIDAGSGATATIKGKVEIETDLTNTTPEVPQDIEIVAVADVSSLSQSTQGGVSISRYSFDGGGSGFGVGVVDNTTGEYSITVPATPDGISVDIEIPSIESNQRLAVGFENGVILPRPEYRDVLASFMPAAEGNPFTAVEEEESDLSPIPVVNGVIAIFPEAPAAGSGFDFSYERDAALLHSFFLHRNDGNVFTSPSDEGSIILQITSAGSGYTSSPEITVTDPTGSGARPEAWVEFAIGGVNLTTAGAGYAANESIDLDFYAIEKDVDDENDDEFGDNQDSKNKFEADFFQTLNDRFIATVTVEADDAGNLTQAIIDAAIAEAIAEEEFGFDAQEPITITNGAVNHSTAGFTSGDELGGLKVVFSGGTPATEPVGLVNVSLGRLIGVTSVFSGEDYTNPSFTFSGGGATTQAAMNVIAYQTQWWITENNSNSIGYSVIPDEMYFEYQVANLNPSISNTYDDEDVLEFDIYGNDTDEFELINDGLIIIDGNGGLQFKDQDRTYKTVFYSSNPPVLKIISQDVENAYVRVDIDQDGKLDDFDTDHSNYGSGYANEFQVSIEPSAIGGPGTGAQVNLLDGSYSNSGFSWDGDYEILSKGSGYVQDLNQQNTTNGVEDFSTSIESTRFDVRTGDVINFNINYGTGVRQIDVEGDWYDTKGSGEEEEEQEGA